MAAESVKDASPQIKAPSVDGGPELQDGARDTPVEQTSNEKKDVESAEEGELHESAPPLPVDEQPPPLPVGEEPPPLPNEAPPDDGWEPAWDHNQQAYYFVNRFTGASQWENPRLPSANTQPGPPGVAAEAPQDSSDIYPTAKPHGGYNPAIHGDYDPNADYAVAAREYEQAAAARTNAQAGAYQAQAGATDYSTVGTFNRFTGKWQSADKNPERHSDAEKSKRQMNAFFDVDAAANSHGGKSLKAERQNQKLSKSELKAFKEKRRERKEEKRRAWLRD